MSPTPFAIPAVVLLMHRVRDAAIDSGELQSSSDILILLCTSINLHTITVETGYNVAFCVRHK